MFFPLKNLEKTFNSLAIQFEELADPKKEQKFISNIVRNLLYIQKSLEIFNMYYF